MRNQLFALGAILATIGFSAAAQTIDNDAVIKMVKAGLGTDVILAAVQSNPGNFKTSAEDLIALKEAGVPDRVLSAMVTKGAGVTAPPPPPSARVEAATADQHLVPEIGVYYKLKGEWKDLPPEVVNWKTGGVVKHVASVGVVKGDMNGLIPGSASRTRLTGTIEILMYLPEGVAASEYQLLKLHEHGKDREFRTVTGGVFHVSGGAERDMVEYEVKKIAPRTYTALLTLAPGEYGFLPPGAYKDKSAGAQLGKMYIFAISRAE